MKRFLIAEDDEQSRYLLETLLNGSGFDVVAVGDGAAAIEAAAGDPPDLLITDILMPVMDGFSLCRAWKADVRLRKIPVIVYTATYTDPRDEELALELGADRFVVKPVEPDAFLEIVRSVLAEHEAGVAAAPREPVEPEEVLFKLYNEALVRKLEGKMLQLDEANRSLAEVVESYRRLLDIANDAILTADAETGEILDCNRAAEELFGRERHAIIGMHQRGLHPPGEAERYERLFHDHVERGHAVTTEEVEILHHDGHTIPVEISAGVSTIEGRRANVGIFRNIRRRLETEGALRESEARFSGLVANMPIGMYRTTPDGRILMSNPALVEMLGYKSSGELAERHLDNTAFGSDFSRDEFVARITQDGEVRGLEYELPRKDGAPILVRENARVVYAEDGSVLYLEGSIEDVTRQRQVEAQLLHAQRMESVGRLAGGVAHDFNNLLQVILGYCELMKPAVEDEKNALRSEVLGIEAAAERATDLTRQLLAFSRKQVLKPTVLNVNAHVESLWKMIARLIGEDIKLSTALPDEPVFINADPGQIEQVILNLAVNARDAMPNGGVLTIEVGAAVIDEADFAGQLDIEPGPFVVITVGDTGCGMDADTRARIFEPFFTTKDLGIGTGLGLSTVFGIAQQSGGAVHVYSEPGSGTVFKVYLPRVQKAEDQASPPRVSVAASRHRDHSSARGRTNRAGGGAAAARELGL